jgi:hypothetical protein
VASAVDRNSGLIRTIKCSLFERFDEIIFSVLVEEPSGVFACYGTAFPILPNVLITAKHVLDELCRNANVQPGTISGINIYALNVLPIIGKVNCAYWQVRRIYVPALSDFALLHVVAGNGVAEKYGDWPVPALTLEPPRIGEKVTAYGITEMTVQDEHPTDPSGKSISTKPIISYCVVSDVFPSKRDAVRLNFPCFQVDGRFDAGMSGGPVVGEAGRVCGIVTSSIKIGEEYVSYAALLWPLMAQLFEFEMLAGIPLDNRVPLQALGVMGIWQPTGWDRVDFEHDNNGKLLFARLVDRPVVKEGGFEIRETNGDKDGKSKSD